MNFNNLGLVYILLEAFRNNHKSYFLLSIPMLLINTIVNKKISNRFNIYFVLISLFNFFISSEIFKSSYQINDSIVKFYSLTLILSNIYILLNKNNKKNIFIGYILTIMITLYIIRRNNIVHYDDIHPLIEPNLKYLDKSNFLFVIPKFKNKKLTNYPKWCNWLKNYAKKNNKILALHGLEHDGTNGFIGDCEFLYEKKKKDIVEGINIFKQAFGYKPIYFKAPCYGLSIKNKLILKKLGLKIIGPETIIFNKLFHGGKISKWKIINSIVDSF